MSNKVANTPEIEAKKLFSQVIEFEYMLIEYFFEGEVKPPHGVTEDDYIKKLFEEYVKLYLERAKIVERRLKK